MKARFCAYPVHKPFITENADEIPTLSLSQDEKVEMRFSLKANSREYRGELSFSVSEFEALLSQYEALKFDEVLKLRRKLADRAR